MIEFRQVLKSDWDFILNLRNDFYENFEKQNSTISKSEHFEYMSKQSKNPDFKQWIVINDQTRIDIGYIRIFNSDISIIVKREYHGKGFGTQILKKLEEQPNLPKKLIGRILPKIKQSIKAFEKAGYTLKTLIYEKNIE